MSVDPTPLSMDPYDLSLGDIDSPWTKPKPGNHNSIFDFKDTSMF